jgi:uncharacterized protein YneF (UPF0154 family)
MTLTHIFYIPVIFLIGLSVGYFMGAKAVRAEFTKGRSRAKE